MPRKTLALISGLVLVTVVLFVIALRTNNSKPSNEVATPSVAVATPVPVATAVLSFSQNPVAVRPGQQGSVDVVLDTADNPVTAVQLGIAYDPTVISNVKVTQGALFPQPVVIKDKNDIKIGRYDFWLGIQPRQATIQGSGVVATVTFTAVRSAVGKQAQISLLPDPETLVTARGVKDSVLNGAASTTVTISNDAPASAATAPAQSGQAATPAN